MTDTERMDFLEAQSSGRGWNVAPRTEGWPLTVVTRGPFATLRQAIDRAMDIAADMLGEEQEASVGRRASESPAPWEGKGDLLTSPARSVLPVEHQADTYLNKGLNS